MEGKKEGDKGGKKEGYDRHMKLSEETESQVSRV